MKKITLVFIAVVMLAAGCGNKTPAAVSQESQEVRAQIQVSQKVEGQFSEKLFNFYEDENKTALDLLKTSYQVETKNFSGVGEFVESIAGTKADSKHFWEFIVNGKSSNIGAGSYKPQNGDKIEWKLTEIK